MNKLTYGDNKITLTLTNNYTVIDLHFIGNYFIDIDCPSNHFSALSNSYRRCMIVSLQKNSTLNNLVIANYEGNLLITKAFVYGPDSVKRKIEIEKLDFTYKFDNIENTFNSADIKFNQKSIYSESYRKIGGKVSNLGSEFITKIEPKKYKGSIAQQKASKEFNKIKKVSRENEKQNSNTSNLY